MVHRLLLFLRVFVYSVFAIMLVVTLSKYGFSFGDYWKTVTSMLSGLRETADEFEQFDGRIYVKSDYIDEVEKVRSLGMELTEKMNVYCKEMETFEKEYGSFEPWNRYGEYYRILELEAEVVKAYEKYRTNVTVLPNEAIKYFPIDFVDSRMNIKCDNRMDFASMTVEDVEFARIMNSTDGVQVISGMRYIYVMYENRIIRLELDENRRVVVVDDNVVGYDDKGKRIFLPGNLSFILSEGLLAGMENVMTGYDETGEEIE